MTRYMLDTNIVSHLVRNNPNVVNKVVNAPMQSLCISAITEGGLLFGLEKRPQAKQLRALVQEVLLRVDVLPWDGRVTKTYAELRAKLTMQGNVIAPLDLLIASHALAINAVLVTNDQALKCISELIIEDWTQMSA